MTTPITLHSPVSGDFSWSVSEGGAKQAEGVKEVSSLDVNQSWAFELGSDALDGSTAVPPVLSVADGTVKSIELLDSNQASTSYDVVVTIEHTVDGQVFHSNYLFQMHGSIALKVGDRVNAGDPIAWISTTGTENDGQLRVIIGKAFDPAGLSDDDLLLNAEHTFADSLPKDGSGYIAGRMVDLPPQSQGDNGQPHAGSSVPVAGTITRDFDIPDINAVGTVGDIAPINSTASSTGDRPISGTDLIADDQQTTTTEPATPSIEPDIVPTTTTSSGDTTTSTTTTATPSGTDNSTTAPSSEPLTITTSSSSSTGLLDDGANNSLVESLVKKFLDGEVGTNVLQSFVTSGSIQVSTGQELFNALKSATGGETIFLKAGNYGTLELNDGRNPFSKFSSEVTLKSADPNNLAVFDSVLLRGVENLTFDNVKFDYDFALGDPEFETAVRIDADSSDIKITNSIFDGDVARGVNSIVDGFGYGNGLFVTNSDNITVSNNEFYAWKRAVVFNNVDDVLVTGNDVHSIRSDGLNFTEVNRVVVEKNHLHDFIEAPLSGDHMDMIQFWTAGTNSPSTDIVVRENVLNSGAGSATQAIFMRNEAVELNNAGSQMFYSNVSILDNVIHNATSHGITVGETNGLTIRNNTLLHNRDSADEGPISVPTISVKPASVNVSVINNVTPDERTVDTAGWNVVNNLAVQLDDPGGEDYVGNLFVNAVAGARTAEADLKAVKGGVIETKGVGANLTRFDGTPESATGYVINERGADLELSTQKFDASNVFGKSGKLDLSGAQIEWNFGDGTFGQGVNAAHDYAKAGSYNVEALITLASGGQAVLRKTIEVETPVALKADFNNGPADLSDLTNAVTAGSAVTFEAGQQGTAARLNNDTISYARSQELRGNSEFSVLFDFKKDAGQETDSGTVVYYSNSFIVDVNANGLTVTLFTDQGRQVLDAKNIGINDAEWHRVAFTFSGNDGDAILYVDGSEVGRLTGLDGAVQTGSTFHDLHVGNPFGGSFSGLVDNVGLLRGAIDAADSNAGFSKLDGQTSSSTTSSTSSSVQQSFVTNSLPIVGTDGVDTLNGTIWKDDIRGKGENDILSGRDGNDFLSGEAGNDLLIGGDGSDVLAGGTGDDILAGLKGADTLQGGQGADLFVLTDTASVDQLTDYIEADGDVLDLTQLFEVDSSGGTKTDSIDDFVRLELDNDAGKTNLQVDQDGGGAGDAFTTIAVVNTTAAIRVTFDDDGTDSSTLLWL